MIEPGSHRMNSDEYHADPCPEPSLSSSIARTLLNATPLHAWFKHPRLNPEWEAEDYKKHLALGTVAHNLLLGAGVEYEVLEHDAYRSNAAKADRDAVLEAGNVPILEHEFQKAEAIVEAARPQIQGHGLPYLTADTGVVEDVFVSKSIGGTWRRAMTDYHSNDCTLVVDYKTTATIPTIGQFSRHAASMGYDFQDSYYQGVMGEAFPELQGRIQFLFAVQEVKPPYAMAVFEIAESDRAVADRKVDAAERIWQSCMERGEWPGHPIGVQRVELPVWHSKEWLDRELEEDEAGEGGSDWTFAGGEQR